MWEEERRDDIEGENEGTGKVEKEGWGSKDGGSCGFSCRDGMVVAMHQQAYKDQWNLSVGWIAFVVGLMLTRP
jgi:hypothetical protein